MGECEMGYSFSNLVTCAIYQSVYMAVAVAFFVKYVVELFVSPSINWHNVCKSWDRNPN